MKTENLKGVVSAMTVVLPLYAEASLASALPTVRSSWEGPRDPWAGSSSALIGTQSQSAPYFQGSLPTDAEFQAPSDNAAFEVGRSGDFFAAVGREFIRALSQPNWDGPSVTSAALNRAIEIVAEIADASPPPPTIAKTSAGGLQILWYTSQKDLEINISPAGEAQIIFVSEPRDFELDYSPAVAQSLVGQIRAVIEA